MLDFCTSELQVTKDVSDMRHLGHVLAPFASLLVLAPALLPLAAGVLVAGCFNLPLHGPFVEVIKVDQLTAEKLKTEIPVYDRDQLKGVRYKVVQPLEATSCKNMLWDPPPTEQDATDQLRFKARTVRANGMMNLSCFTKEGTSLSKNCWQSFTCNAIAIQVSP